MHANHAQDPSKPCVKNHHSLVLRAESASEKFMWLARLKNASEGSGGARPPVRGYTSDSLRADSVTSSMAPTPRAEPPIRRGGVRAPCCLMMSTRVLLQIFQLSQDTSWPWGQFSPLCQTSHAMV